jgi:predicted SnoaL-like aldol condensation-catalyzing enzyme
MSTEQNKINVVRWREEIWNNRNLNIVDELAVPEYVCHLGGTPDPIQGRESLKALFAANLAAFDTHVSADFAIAEGNMVAVHDTYWLKHTGEFQGHPPTGNEVKITSTDIYRIVEGRFTEQWFEADLTGMLYQLVGLLPNTEHPGLLVRRPTASRNR